MKAVRTENLSVRLGEAQILHGISLNLDGGLTGLVGPNGSGKTTLVRALAGLVPFDGVVLLGDTPTKSLPARTVARRVAYVAQDQTAHWPLDVWRVVALGRLPHLSPWQGIRPEDDAAIARAMERMDVADLADRNVMTLSSGERARVMLARALAVEASVLLVDEPIASLDPYHQLQVMELLQRDAGAGTTVLAVLHDLTLAARFCERLLLLSDGHVIADGPPGSVLSDDNLARAYKISARRGEGVDGTGGYLIPWERIDGVPAPTDS